MNQADKDYLMKAVKALAAATDKTTRDGGKTIQINRYYNIDKDALDMFEVDMKRVGDILRGIPTRGVHIARTGELMLITGDLPDGTQVGVDIMLQDPNESFSSYVGRVLGPALSLIKERGVEI